jgi:hypothetical protein
MLNPSHWSDLFEIFKMYLVFFKLGFVLNGSIKNITMKLPHLN